MEEHFDQVARAWDLEPVHVKRTEAIRDAMIAVGIMKGKMRGIEFGAGTGLLGIALQKYFKELTLMDASKEMVKVTNEKLRQSGFSHIKALLIDLETEEFPYSPVDLLFMQMALHHVSDLDVVLKKFRSMLVTGGTLAIADLYREDGSFHQQEFHGHLGFDPQALSERLIVGGFRNTAYKECFRIIRPNANGSVKEYPVFLLTASSC
jgi:tRNA (cmo5U34)-methyltransferase